MKKVRTILAALLILSAVAGNAQGKWFTRNGKINFFSKTNGENIDADNNEVFSMIDPVKNEMAFQVLNTGFKFHKALMQEHFNENYMESSKYPKASFKGNFTDPSKIDFTKDGTYKVLVAGDLTMHGETKKINIPATIIVAGGKVSGESKFNIKLADYDIKIPSVVSNQISEDVAVTVKCQYEAYK
ncbi:MAG: YceI family protein [Ginsengibacter sp.]